MANDKAAAPAKKIKGRHKSAQKRARASLRRASINSSWETRVKTFEKKVAVAIGKKNADEAKKALVVFMSQIDKAAQKGAVHVKRAARRISRLSKQISQLT